MSERDSIRISRCFSSKAFVLLGPEGRQNVAPPEAPSRVLCAAERGWGTGLPNDIQDPLAGRKNLSGEFSDKQTIIPCIFLSEVLSLRSPLSFSFHELVEPNSTGWVHEVISGPGKFFLDVGASAEERFSTRAGGLFPSASME
jgi:hypothetical protein